MHSGRVAAALADPAVQTATLLWLQAIATLPYLVFAIPVLELHFTQRDRARAAGTIAVAEPWQRPGWRGRRTIVEEGTMSAERSDVAADLPNSDAEWRKRLTPEQYYVLRQKGTERPWSGEYNLTKVDGMYRCAGCGTELFSSDSKFDSHCGWPSFTEPTAAEKVDLTTDYSHGMVRTEVTCKRCGGHLGHVFDDGPLPTGQRYCINSVSLKLDPSDS
jgi:peptide-methionine (R)-S-oxide reductase